MAESTALRMRNEPGDAQRKLRTFDEENYMERPGPARPAGPAGVARAGALRPRRAGAELHATEGHTADGMAVWVPWASVLVAGDYLSPVEIPMISGGGSLSAYLATLDRLAPIVEHAAHVVPGHGGAIDGTRAAAILREDRSYLEALRDRGAEAPLPLARRTGAQKAIHTANVAAVAG